MATTVLDSKKNLTYNQSSKDSTNQLYTAHIKENLSDSDIYTMNINKETSKNVDINNLFKVYHQNIRGLRGKIKEFMYSLLSETPHFICMTEHPLKDYETDITPITKYKLCAKYCRNILKNGGVCIYIQESLKFTNFNLQKWGTP